MADAVLVIVGIIILTFYFTTRFLLKKQIVDVTMEAEVKEAILSLFLYAEKQGFADKEKMNFVANRIHDLIPGATLQAVLKEDQIASYLQHLYDEFKSKLL